MAVNAKGYFDFLKAMVFELRWGDVDALVQRDRETLDTLIQDAAHKTFFPLKPGTDTVHQWSWADPLRSLIVRSAVTGTLLDVPSRSGEEIILRANEAIFDSDLVGHDITFDTTGQRYTITSFVRESAVKAIPSERSPEGQLNQFGDRTEVTVSSAVGPGSSPVPIGQTLITGGHATKVFNADMGTDKVVFASGNSYPVVRVDVDNDQIVVTGDASSETLAMTVERNFKVSILTTGSRHTIVSGSFPFRQDMEDDSDTIVWVGDVTVYTITEFITTSKVVIDLDATGEGEGVNATIKKSFGTGYTVAANVNETMVTIVEDNVFQAAHVGSYLAYFDDPSPGTVTIPTVGISGFLKLFKIVEVLDGQRVKVSGDASRENPGTATSLVRAGGELDQSTTKTFDGASTLLTSTTSIFTSGMVGVAIEFIRTDNKYAIVEFVSATQVKVSGNATQEGYPLGQFIVNGPTDLAADDAFTVVNTGGDYELPEDYGGMNGEITYSTDSLLRTIVIATRQMIRIARQRDSSVGYPRIASIAPQLHDGRFTQRMIFSVYPIPDAKHTIEFEQTVILPKITADNPFPPGGAAFGDLYQAACLAEVESRVLNRVHGGRWTEFQEALARMIEFDNIGSGPEWMGRGYEEGRRGSFRRFPRTGGVTYITT